MATKATRSSPTRRDVLTGPLILAATLFVAVLCAGVTVLWLLEDDRQPGAWTAVVGVLAVAVTVISAYADNSWSARVTRTTELGNVTRLFAVATVLLLVPTVILQAVEEDRVELEARGTSSACPEGRVPDVAFEDLEAGSDLRAVASCLRWWGVLPPELVAFAGADTVLAGELASRLDRLVIAGAVPLPEVPDVAAPDPASPDAAAIVRVVSAGLLGTGDVAAFAPGEPVTRGELSAAVNRAHRHVTGAPLPDPEEEAFSDVEGTPHADDIEAVAAAGISIGAPDGTFEPAAAVNRTEVANVLVRTLDLWVAEGVVGPPG